LHKFAHMKKVTQLGGDENVVMESHIHYWDCNWHHQLWHEWNKNVGLVQNDGVGKLQWRHFHHAPHQQFKLLFLFQKTLSC
jgi:hypothetical protein